jgi:hypothetical protein
VCFSLYFVPFQPFCRSAARQAALVKEEFRTAFWNGSRFAGKKQPFWVKKGPVFG